jgi:hypothetical protein
MTIFFCLAILSGGLVGAGLSEAEFRDPPAAARPSALWSWLNGHVEHRQITRELEEMKAKGMRGAIIWDVGSIADPEKIIPAGPAFLGPESLAAIHHAMDEAERLGLELGLFASSSWNAGGPWITPKDASKELRWSELRVKGPKEFSAALPLPDKTTGHFEDLAVMALPFHPDKSMDGSAGALRLDGQLADDGRLTWSVPAGEWSILRFICHNTGQNLVCPSPNSKGLLIDHLSREGTDAHINHMLDALLRGRDDYGPLKMLMLDSYEVWHRTDWTPDFGEEFVKRMGYDPIPWLPALAGWKEKGSEELAQRFRHDYGKVVGDLIVDEHFARSRELLNKRGLLLLAEAGHGGAARVDPLKALGAADIPMGEFWNHRKNWVTKEAASAAHIYGKQLVDAETLTGWQHWQDGPAAYMRLFDIALCAGLNRASFHTFAHNPPEAGLPGFGYHAGEHFNVNSTWWEHSGPMLENMSRSCHLLQQGQFVADVCAYYGDGAPNLVPARRIAPTVKPRWSDEHCLHCGRPQPVDLRALDHGYDYDYVNEEVILSRMEVRDGRIVLPDGSSPSKPGLSFEAQGAEKEGRRGMSYRVLVLPDREAISVAVLRRIGELVEAGATVVGRKPVRSNSLKGFPGCDREVADLAAKIWGDCDGDKVLSHAYGKGRVIWNVPLNDVLAGMGVEPDFGVEGIDNGDRHIDFIHRSTADEDIYFVSNSAMEREGFTARFRVGPGRVPSFWHPENGSVTKCHVYETGKGFVRLPLDLPPASSVFVVFRKGEHADHLVGIEARTADETPDRAGPAIEVLDLESGKVSTLVRRPGTYVLKTASGRSGQIVVDQVPAEQIVGGPWQLSFPEGRGAPESLSLDDLTDWTEHSDPGVRYFSGTATYRKQFALSDAAARGGGPIILDLGSVREVAEVTVNGRNAGLLWKQPYRIDIAPFTKAGGNQLEVSVTNLWNNRIVGDLQSDADRDFTRTNLKSKFSAKSPLLPSGLTGPVKLRFPVSATTHLK